MSTLYTSFIRPILFRMDPETAHQVTLRVCAAAGRSNLLKRIVHSRLRVSDPRLKQTIAGVEFDNPLGLAGGLDKNGDAVQMLSALGFGHVEIGSISAYPSKGNPRPRLFRIPQDEGIIVHYGVPNDGAHAVAATLSGMSCPVPLGISLVKTNDPRRPPNDEEVLSDYAQTFAKLQDFASYIHLNLSCPNSANDRNYFDQVSRIDALLQRLARVQPCKPVFLKLKPTDDRGFLQELVAALDPFPFVAGLGMNLPAGRPAQLQFKTARAELAKMPGSVSGRPVERLANANLRLLYEVIGARSRYKLMAAGGVFSAEDAYRKIRLGASLVQIYTALVYRGPGIAKHMSRDLAALLARDGFRNVTEAVGADVA
jgi:dihydroorotate dehydrogenase